MGNKFLYALTSLLMLISNDVFCQGKLVEVNPQNPSGAASSTGIRHIFMGDKVNVLVSENFKNFGSPSYSVFYLQQYDYDLNLIKEEPIKHFNYTDTIYNQERVLAGWLTKNSGFFIYVEGINDSADKSYFEVRDSLSNVVFSKVDVKLLDVPLFSHSINYMHDFALVQNKRLIRVSRTGVEMTSYDLDSLESELQISFFPQADSLKLLDRMASKPSANKSYYSLSIYNNGFDTYYSCSFDDSFQLLDSIQGTALNDYRIENYRDNILLLSDSTVIDSNTKTYRSFYQFKDFNLNTKFSFQISGGVVYGFNGLTNSDSWVFNSDGSLNLVNGEHFVKPQDTIIGHRVRYFDSTGTAELNHIFYEDGVPKSNSGISVYSTFGRSSIGEFIVPLRAWIGNSFILYRSFLLKIDTQGNSPLSINVVTENKAIEIYPNPSKNWLKINTNKPDEFFKIKILDLKGQIVLDQKAISKQQIDVSELPPGTYLMHLEGISGAWLNTYKFIKL